MSLIKSYSWDLVGKVANQLVSFMLGIFLARMLSPTEYGLIGMSMVFIAFSNVFVNLGLSTALIQKKNAIEEHFSSSFFVNISIAIILTVLFFLIAPVISSFFSEDKIVVLIQVLSFNLIITSLSVVAEVKLIKQLNFKILSKIGVSSSVVSGLVAIYFAFNGYGVWSLVIQTLLSSIIRSFLIQYYSRWRPKLIFKIEALKELWSYSFRFFISGFINTIYEQLDSIIIARIFSTVDLGLYSRAKSLNRFVIKYASESIGNVTFPAMSKISDDKLKMIELGLKAESLVAFLSFGLLGLLFITAKPLFLLLFGIKWIAAIPIYKLLCLSGFAYPISATTLSMLKASGDSKTFLKLEVLKKILGLISLSIGFYYGMNGFLLSLIVSGLIGTVLNIYFTSYSLDISFKNQIVDSFIYVIPAVIAVIITYFSLTIFLNNILILISSSFIYICVYLLINELSQTKGYEIMKVKFFGLLNINFDTSN